MAEATGVTSEPEVTELDDETGEIPLTENASGPDVPSPMAALPSGATFGSLVHAVLENADPGAADFAAELEGQVQRQLRWWSVDVTAAELAAALVPMNDTSLGPLAGGLTLRQIGLRDRLRELDFEIPLAGGDVRGAVPNVSVSDVGELLRRASARRRSGGAIRRSADVGRAGQPVVARILGGLDRRGAATAR